MSPQMQCSRLATDCSLSRLFPLIIAGISTRPPAAEHIHQNFHALISLVTILEALKSELAERTVKGGEVQTGGAGEPKPEILPRSETEEIQTDGNGRNGEAKQGSILCSVRTDSTIAAQGHLEGKVEGEQISNERPASLGVRGKTMG